MLNVLSTEEIKWVSEYYNLAGGVGPPLALWIIGLPGAGKTTVATLLREHLQQLGFRAELVDGDVVRLAFRGSLGYSLTDRLLALRKYVQINQILQDRNIITITATIGGVREFREIVRKSLKNPRFIFLDCPLDVASKRDRKGLYRKALAGELKNVFGVDIDFEKPAEGCEMVIDSASMNPSEIIARITGHLAHSSLI